MRLRDKIALGIAAGASMFLPNGKTDAQTLNLSRAGTYDAFGMNFSNGRPVTQLTFKGEDGPWKGMLMVNYDDLKRLNEFDFGLSYKFPLDKNGKVNASVGFVEFPSRGADGAWRNMGQVYAKIENPLFTIAGHQFYQVGGEGRIYSISRKDKLPIGKEDQALIEAGFKLAYNDGAFMDNPGWSRSYLEGSLGASWNLTDRLKIGGKVVATHPFSKEIKDRATFLAEIGYDFGKQKEKVK